MRNRGHGNARQGHRSGGRWRPTAALLGAVALLALGGGAVAHGADGPQPDTPQADSLDLGMVQYDYTFAPTPAGAESITRLIPATLLHHDPNAAVRDQRLTVDAVGLKGVADVVWPKSCTVTGSNAVCTVPGVPVGTLDLPDLGLGIRPLPGVAAPATGSLTVALRNLDGKTQTVKATVKLADGPSLAVGRAPAATLAPGAKGDVPVTVTNEGNAELPSLRLDYRWSYGLIPAEHFSNCLYDTSTDEVYGLPRNEAHCTVDQPLAAGKSYGVRNVLAMTANEDAYAEQVELTAYTPDLAPPRPPGARGAGPELRLAPVDGGTPGAAGRNDNPYGGTRYQVTNTADFGLSATEVTGKKGATVRTTVHIDNHGPAAIAPAKYFVSVARFDLEVPDGTELVAWPGQCAPRDAAKRYLRCSSETEFDVQRSVLLAPGHSYDFELTLRITAAGTHTGQAHLLTTGPNRVELPFDHDAANDTARLVVKTAGAAGSSTTGGTSGSSGTKSGGGTGTASLPTTGAGNTPLLGGLAAGAVLAGGTVLFISRRRQPN